MNRRLWSSHSPVVCVRVQFNTPRIISVKRNQKTLMFETEILPATGISVPIGGGG